MYRTVYGHMVFSLFHKKTSWGRLKKWWLPECQERIWVLVSTVCMLYTHIYMQHTNTQSQIIMHPKAKLKRPQSTDKPNEFKRQNSSQASKMKLLRRVTYVLIQLRKKSVLHWRALDSCGSWEKAESQIHIPANIQIGSLAEWTNTHSFCSFTEHLLYTRHNHRPWV